MKIQALPQGFSICKMESLSQADLTGAFVFAAKTDEEISLVCCTEAVPPNALECDHGWRAFRIQGVLDFSLVGILAKISTLLAESQIGIFAVSTFNTDYILTKAENFQRAIEVLGQNGYETGI